MTVKGRSEVWFLQQPNEKCLSVRHGIRKIDCVEQASLDFAPFCIGTAPRSLQLIKFLARDPMGSTSISRAPSTLPLPLERWLLFLDHGFKGQMKIFANPPSRQAA
jgi:hypothetical protein